MVTRDTTLPAGRYEFAGPVVVREAVLRLEAGAHLVFQGSHALLVETGGSLLALGDSLHPVVLEGDSWQGIRLSATEAGSHLAFCEIRGAGMPAALLLYSTGKTTVTHTWIHGNAGFGVYLNAGARFQAFRFNRLEDNGWYPVLCQDLEALQNLDSTNLLGNGGRVGVWIDRSVRVQHPITLRPGPQNPVHLDGDLEITDTLDLARGHLRLRGQIRVLAGGVFRVRQVLLEPLGASWPGVWVDGGNLDWREVTLEAAGTPAYAAVRVQPGSGPVKWVEGTVASPPGTGVDLGVVPDSVWEVAVSGAGAVPVILRHARILAAPLRFSLSDNPSPWIRVNSARVTASDTWRSPGAPVVFTGNLSLVSEDGTPTFLYLLPGLELRFYDYAGLWVGFNGPAGLVAQGVRFTARDLADPAWRSLRFGPETVAGTRLDSCILEYGGDVRTQPDSGIVVITDTQVPVLEGNLIRYSHTYGVYLRGGADTPAYRQEILSRNTFEANALGDLGPSLRKP